MKYWKGIPGDYVVQADSHEEAVEAIERRILAGIVPMLSVDEVDMEPSKAEDYGTLGEPEGPWVGVEVYGLIVQAAHIFWKEEEALAWFKEYTGYDYDEWIKSDEPLDLEYDQCKLFTLGAGK